MNGPRASVRKALDRLTAPVRTVASNVIPPPPTGCNCPARYGTTRHTETCRQVVEADDFDALIARCAARLRGDTP